MRKILTIIGARPQFIKAAVVSRALKKYDTQINEILLHTGQHFDSNMSDVFFNELSIPKPKYNLGIGGGTHGQNTGRMIEKVEEVLLLEKPDWMLVYGDTDSTLAGAIAASKLHIPIAHVEAGLRSYNRRMPEEINRILTDQISTLLFTPTITATNNLLKEGFNKEKIKQVGDVMFDAAMYYGEQVRSVSKLFDELSLNRKEYILVTLHRAENVDDKQRLINILNAFRNVKRKFIWPIHPRTKNRISALKISIPSNVTVIDPVGYLDMVFLQKNALLIATDSGGVQKEAYFHKVPCVTLRDETEWVELVVAGVNVLTGANEEKIITAINKQLHIESNAFNGNLYGEGDTALKIANFINNTFN